MKCPICGTWTEVLETRTRKTDGTTTRRYQCANLHRFTTREQVVPVKEAKRCKKGAP